MRRYRSLIPALAALVALIAINWGCASTTSPIVPLVYHEQYSSNVSTLYGDVGAERKSLTDLYAPDFHWTRSDGTLDSLTGHQGQVVVLNFWATWCTPCKSEMPDLQRLANELGDTAFVIGVADDNQGDAFSKTSNFVWDNHYNYQFVVDSNYKLYEKYELYPPDTPIPVSEFIDASGQLRYYHVGALSEADFLSVIRKIE